jgi:RNA polymerase II subunit A-like phosphatase
MTPALKKKSTTKTDTDETEATKKGETTTSDTGATKAVDQENLEAPEADGSRISALEELVRMGGGDDQALRLEQAAEQEKFLEKQLTERPLLHMQEKLDQEEEDEEAAVTEETKNGDTAHEHTHHKHNLLKDDDVELTYLEKHLTQLHKAFYDDYDRALVSAHGGRVAQLKPGHNKKVSIKDESADLRIVPDIGHVMPRLK